MAHLEDNNDTEEIDPRYEAKDGEDADVVRVVQPKFGRAPEYCHHNPDLKNERVSAHLTYFQLQRSSRNSPAPEEQDRGAFICQDTPALNKEVSCSSNFSQHLSRSWE